MELVKDTLSKEAEQTHPADGQKTGSGDAKALGGGDAPALSASEQSHGQDAYPGPRPGGETAKESNRTTPEAGDTDPGSNASADATGQAGDIAEPDKNKANPWNG